MRAKTQEFKVRIKDHLRNIDDQIADLGAKAEALPFNEISGKDVFYQQIDGLKKERDEQLEEVLKTILPEAFAVVKETASRFKDNVEVVATATELDRNLSVKKEHIRIDGDQVIYNNSWMAAGSPTTWNMVHYDVQLKSAVRSFIRVRSRRWRRGKVKRLCLRCRPT